MTGAIEFMKAWRNICKRQWRCDGCPIEELCRDYGHEISDKHIAELVRQVMAEARKNADENKPKTGRWEWIQYNPNIGNWHCSECRTIVTNPQMYKYCPNCGIKMEVDE